jgi:4-hydroxybenzoyl-CoA thioesterase
VTPFEHDWTCRFADADPFGIAHYPDIVAATTDVSDRFMAEIGYSWAALATEHDAGMPIVEVHFEFESPVRADDVVTIELRPSLGDRSVRFSYEGRHADGSLAFTGYEQRAYVEKGADRASPIPDWLREAMAPYVDGGE